MSYRDEQDDGRYAAPGDAGSRAGTYERDEDFIRGNDRPANHRRRRSGSGTIMRLLLTLLLALVVVAGGLYAAIHFRLVDPAQFGRSGLLPGLPGSGSRPNAPGGQADVIFDGDSALLSSAPGNTVQPDASARIAWLRTNVKSASASGATDGVSIVIPREVLPRFEGRRARVTISARSGAEGDSVPFAAAYSAGPRGNSNWIVFVPEKDFTDHSFSFVVPIGDLAGSDDHRIAIWADIEGRGIPLGIRSITMRPE